MRTLGKYILDADLRVVPCDDLLTWAQWLQDHQAECKVALDKVGPVTVSTVFLGLNHNAVP